MFRKGRLEREGKTLKAMVKIFCRDQHPGGRTLCSECQNLLDYALERLNRCPFEENKTSCARCPVHCYRRTMRDEIRAVMRRAGPKMAYRHPVMTLFHFMDGMRKAPLPLPRKTDP